MSVFMVIELPDGDDCEFCDYVTINEDIGRFMCLVHGTFFEGDFEGREELKKTDECKRKSFK